ncbi:hypothetical protein PYW08_008626 [Mythimna loreyi]|uniref:Uncharacterized protein n=1 Tax=Mythimna loreyi TaxID=667449 RepID=A0ACC2QAT2_9NEOP|nr:hypothetical protein PYW08_008626 [Mythimna loreyi]
MKSIFIPIFFALIVIPYHGETKPHRRKLGPDSDEDLTADRETQYYCHKLKGCTPGGEKVCGFDEYIPWLVEFQDICSLYKTNCKDDGKFYPVDQIVCDTRIKYDKEHANETFEVIHIRPTEDTNRPVQENIFDSYYCYKRSTCTPNNVIVCGINQEKTVAIFKDLCFLYDINCMKEGRYLETSMEQCNKGNVTQFFGIDEKSSHEVLRTSGDHELDSQIAYIEEPSSIDINYTLHV